MNGSFIAARMLAAFAEGDLFVWRLSSSASAPATPPSMFDNPNTFANFPLDKAGHRRKDPAWLDEALKSDAARIIPFKDKQPLLLLGADGAPNGEAGWLSAHAIGPIGGAKPMTLFLGVDEAGAPHFALNAQRSSDMADQLLEGMGVYADMRAAAGQLPPGDVAILGAAKSLFEWHGRHSYCSNCGSATAIAEGGWKRECPDCKGEHFPRVDPVVIMTATCNDKILLGRQKRWPKGMYSALAGFVEPGETIEEACARELMEEAGITAKNPRYLFAQPWPFPSSLMMGMIAETENEDCQADGDELEEVRWFTRAEVTMMLNRRHPDAFAPQPIAIAHHVIRAWYEGA
jgi:NAD+ diphosphatase